MAVSVVVPLDRSSGIPLAQQVAAHIREAVHDRRLLAGDRLPSSRTLGKELGVARGVVQQAYDQLTAEGWLHGRQGAGTFVTDVVPLSRRARKPREPAGGRRTASKPGEIALRAGVPWTDRRTSAAWRRAWRGVSATAMPPGYPDPQGLLELREQVCAYLGRARGIACAPEEVLISGGTTHAWRLLLETIAGPGWHVAHEDPGYRAATDVVRTRGLGIVDVPVDFDGLDVEALRRAHPRPELVYVTPSHQHPIGVSLTAARRHELIAWAREHDALIVEDDYDSEFRYDVAPLPAMAQLDRDRVIYLGTTSKTFGPALRLGWLVGSANLVARIAEHRDRIGDFPSWPVEAAYASLLAEGYVDTVVRRMRRFYAERSARVCDALEPFGEVTGRNAGLHVTLLLPKELEWRVQARARERGLHVEILAEGRRNPVGPSGVVVGYGAVSAADLERGLEILVGVLRDELH